MLKRGNDHHGLNGLLYQHSAKGIEANALSRISGDFERFEPETLDDLQEAEESRTLERDRVAGFSDDAQAKVQGLGASKRHDDFIVRKLCAHLQEATSDFTG